MKSSGNRPSFTIGETGKNTVNTDYNHQVIRVIYWIQNINTCNLKERHMYWNTTYSLIREKGKQKTKTLKEETICLV